MAVKSTFCAILCVVIFEIVLCYENAALWPLTSQHGGNDVSGNRNHGTLNGNLMPTFGVHNEPGGATYFPGNSAGTYMYVTNAPGSSLQLSRSSYSVSGFFRRPPGTVTGGSLLNFTPNLNEKVWFFTDEVEIKVFDIHMSTPYYVMVDDGSGGKYFMPEIWTFFTLGYDMDGDLLAVWRNGELVTTKPIPNFSQHRAATDIEIGKKHNTFQTKGSLSCLRITSGFPSNDDVIKMMDDAADGCPCHTAKKLSRSYKRYRNMRLDDAMIESYNVTMRSECARYCLTVCGCVSFNVKQAEGRITCELNRWSPKPEVGDTNSSLYRVKAS